MSLIGSRHGVLAALALFLLIAAGSTASSRVAADNRDNHNKDRVQASRSDRNSRQDQVSSPGRGTSQNHSQVFTPRTSIPVPTTGGRVGTPQAAQTDTPRRGPLVLGGAARPTVVPNGRQEEWRRVHDWPQGGRWIRENGQWVYRGYGYGAPYYRSGYYGPYAPAYGGYGGGYGYPGGGYGYPGGGYGYPGYGGYPAGAGSGGWEAKGYRDGLNRGREDAQTHRTPNPNNSEHFRNGNPAYRAGFARGYRVGYGQYRGYGRRF